MEFIAPENKILLVTVTIGEIPPVRLALVDEAELEGIDLDMINGLIVNTNDDEIHGKRLQNRLCNQVERLYWRLGLEKLSLASEGQPVLPRTQQAPYAADLERFLDPEPPFACKKVVLIGWTI